MRSTCAVNDPVMDDETRALLREFVDAAKAIPSPRPPALISKQTLLTAMAATIVSSAVLSLIQFFSYGGTISMLAKHVDAAMASGVNNADELRRIEGDYKSVVREVRDEWRGWTRDHMQYEHPRSGRRSSAVNGWHPPLRLVGALVRRPALLLPAPVQTPWRARRVGRR